MGDSSGPKSPNSKINRPLTHLKIPDSSVKTSPTYLIMKRTGDEGFKKVSPFFIDKFITGLVGNVRKIKKIRDGSLLIETSNRQQSETLLLCTDFGGQFPIQVTPHKTLNYSKGVIRYYDFQFLEIEEIKRELSPIIQDIIRINQLENIRNAA